jgi:hypothetical protein
MAAGGLGQRGAQRVQHTRQRVLVPSLRVLVPCCGKLLQARNALWHVGAATATWRARRGALHKLQPGFVAFGRVAGWATGDGVPNIFAKTSGQAVLADDGVKMVRARRAHAAVHASACRAEDARLQRVRVRAWRAALWHQRLTGVIPGRVNHCRRPKRHSSRGRRFGGRPLGHACAVGAKL